MKRGEEPWSFGFKPHIYRGWVADLRLKSVTKSSSRKNLSRVWLLNCQSLSPLPEKASWTVVLFNYELQTRLIYRLLTIRWATKLFRREGCCNTRFSGVEPIRSVDSDTMHKADNGSNCICPGRQVENYSKKSKILRSSRQ